MTSSNSTLQSGSGMTFRVPPILRNLFDRFPLVTYPANELPPLEQGAENHHKLYIFSTHGSRLREGPSFHPTSLKWQTLLHFYGVPFVAVCSNNHASPTGMLPFLLPKNSNEPVRASKIADWAASHSPHKTQIPDPYQHMEYHVMLSDAVRRAYLYSLYIWPQTFENIGAPRYIAPTSTNPLVRAHLTSELRRAATLEIGTVDTKEQLLNNAATAWHILSKKLGDRDFFGGAQPVLLDAGVFSYTNTILELFVGGQGEQGNTPGNEMAKVLASLPKLVAHRKRILDRYYPES